MGVKERKRETEWGKRSRDRYGGARTGSEEGQVTPFVVSSDNLVRRLSSRMSPKGYTVFAPGTRGAPNMSC